MSQNPSLNENTTEEPKNSTSAATLDTGAAPEMEKKTVRRRRKAAADTPERKETAPVRKRRTSRKNSGTETQEEVAENSTAPLPEATLPLAPVSAASVPAETAAAGASPEEVPAPAKRRRGRPRKSEVSVPSPTDAAPAEAAETPVRRTRVRRSRTAETPAGGVPAGESTPADAPPESAAASAPEVPAQAVSAPDVSAPNVPETPAKIDAAPKARRGRKPRARKENTTAEANVEAEPGNQAADIAPVPEDDLGNRADSRPQPPLWPDDDAIITSILPAEGSFGDIRSQRRINPRTRRKRDRDAQPLSNASPYLPDPYQQNFYPPFTGMDGNAPFGGRKPRNGRGRPRRSAQGVPAIPEDFDFNAAMLNDSVLGVALGRREEELLPEDDGPQPVLPDQPAAMPPFGEENEEDLDALDAAVNGNRIDAPKPRERQPQKKGRPAEKAKAGEKPRAAEKAKGAEPAPAPRRVLYISSVPDEQVEVAITEDGNVMEYFVEMAHQAKIRGNIYKGVINNIDTNLQAAFVNFGNGKNGFLQIDEVHPEYYLVPHDSAHGPKYPPIQKVLKVGQDVLVQVVKEPSGSKGAFLTTWISIAGRFLVLTPGQEQIGVSRKVEDPEERARLKELLSGIQPGENMGVIIRTASEGADKASIQQDMQYLKMLWQDIRKRAVPEKSPCLIYQEADLVARSVRDYLSEDIEEIWTDDEAIKSRVEDTAALIFPDRARELVKLHKDQRQTLWDRFNLTKQLESVTSREVVLPSGGRLVFDQTEALMAIDINSGKTQGKTNFEAMVFRTNMEAAEAIARHLRLRDIGGQVVIDFIEMRDKNHCRDVERTLRTAMRRDRARHDIGHMSSFGLLELVRQRTGTSAISISCESCPHCHGTGVRRNMEWQSLQALRDLQAKLYKNGDRSKSKKDAARSGSEPATFVYENEMELALYLLNRKRDRLAALEEKFGVHIEIRPK